MSTRQALAGVKVLDFTWALAGPIATKCLADHGASVLKVETMSRPDMTRLSQPYLEGKPGVNRSRRFASFNSGKMSFALNLNQPRGRGVALRLVAWADVVTENYTPGTLERWNLGYDELKRVNPDIIVVRAAVQGQEGPEAQHVSFGAILSGLAGFYSVTGWPDRGPAMSAGIAYTDFIAPWFVVVTILGALDYRRRTGKGQMIDFSQMEASEQFLAPAILDYTVNGRVRGREGNRSANAAPHGAYRCQGEDRWCVIAVFTKEEWWAFCGAIGRPALVDDPRFATLEVRKENEDQLEQLVQEWTRDLPADEVMARMQAAGVPAGVVQDARDLVEDPQLQSREILRYLEHPESDEPFPYKALSPRLSRTPAELHPAPILGQDTASFCTEVLGMSDQEFVDLLEEGVLR